MTIAVDLGRKATKQKQDPGVASLIPAESHTFVEVDHEIIFRAILLPSADSKRVVVNYKRKYVYEVLVSCLIKLAC